MKKLTSNGLRAEITLGLKVGEKEAFSKKSVITFWRELLLKGKTFPVRVVDTELVYPVNGKVEVEPALILSLDKNSRYGAELSEEEWKKVVEETTEALRKEFNQERVYVTFLEVEVSIVGGE